MTLKFGMQHRVLKYYQACSNNDPELTLTYFRARSNLVPYAFDWEKGKAMDFSETIVVYEKKKKKKKKKKKTFMQFERPNRLSEHLHEIDCL